MKGDTINSDNSIRQQQESRHTILTSTNTNISAPNSFASKLLSPPPQHSHNKSIDTAHFHTNTSANISHHTSSNIGHTSANISHSSSSSGFYPRKNMNSLSGKQSRNSPAPISNPNNRLSEHQHQLNASSSQYKPPQQPPAVKRHS